MYHTAGDMHYYRDAYELPACGEDNQFSAYSAGNGHLIPRELAARSAVKWPLVPEFWPHVPG
jgi:hypothetical protein